MILNLKKNSFLTFKIIKKGNKYLLNVEIKNKYLHYYVFSKVKYEQLITVIENIESMLFARYRTYRAIELKRVKIEFDSYQTGMKIYIKICDNQEYTICLKRSQIIDIYSYITKQITTLNKVEIINLNKKYTYVEVRYIDVYSTRTYSYISEDKSIKVGDIVYVDRAGTKCLAVVQSKNNYYFEEAPYPVLETKRVISIVTRTEKYKSL